MLDLAPTPLQQDCVFQIWRNTAAATGGLFTGHFVRKIPDVERHRCYGTSHCCVWVNSFGTGSQHIPDLEQHPFHMLVNSFGRFDNPDLKQHRCWYGTVYGSNRFIMYYYDSRFFSALPSSFSTWHRLHLTLRVAVILQKM